MEDQQANGIPDAPAQGDDKRVNLFAQLSDWERRGFAAAVYGLMRGAFDASQAKQNERPSLPA